MTTKLQATVAYFILLSGHQWNPPGSDQSDILFYLVVISHSGQLDTHREGMRAIDLLLTALEKHTAWKWHTTPQGAIKTNHPP